MITKIADKIYWVGVIDWGIRKFHGHELSVHRGTTYNSYLIVDQKIALVDTVWGPFSEELIANISQIIPPSKINYVIANHAEVDHSGALPAIMQYCPDATVVVSRNGAESIPGHYHSNWKIKSVNSGDTISLGTINLRFIEAPLLHWPDSMFTYAEGPNVLMPNDAFGQHYATAFRFNDEVNNEELYAEALKYYVNILTPFSERVSRKISELISMNIPVEMIAPSHGVIWRKDPLLIVKKYQEWAEQKPEKSAVVLYDTMWEATRKMAVAISDGIAEGNVPARVFHMAVADRNDVLVEIFKAKAIIIGCPTFNRGLLPSITPVLEDCKGLRFKNKISAAFGSFGWSGESVKIIEEYLEKCGFKIVIPGLKVKWQPRSEDIVLCRNMGKTIALEIKKE